MSQNQPLIVELGVEELPAASVLPMATYLAEQLVDALKAQAFEPGDFHIYATPKRIAVLIDSVKAQQADREIERKGPAVQAAFDDDGNPKPAALGFAKSCGVDIADVQRLKTDKGEWLYYKLMQTGESLNSKLAPMLVKIFSSMPMPKRMRWSDSSVEFLRPVHWMLVMHGDQGIDGEVLGLSFGKNTRGHRFHVNEWIELASASDYEQTLLNTGKVIADFGKRRAVIVDQVMAIAKDLNATAVMEESLIDEITAIVEWPVAIAGSFETEYLEVPKEALIQTMQDNQRYFPLLDDQGELMAGFITVVNIESSNPESVRKGNERVVRPRLADARFFWQQDQAKPLASHLESLKKVVFQKQLGSVYDKTERLMFLAENIAQELGVNPTQCKRAAELSKCDLMTEMVNEFAKMQGIAGRYYAAIEGEEKEVSDAIEAQYLPKQAGDKTPSHAVGQVVAIAEKLDTLGAIIGIGQMPTGAKDPFALRRTSLGILRIIIENNLDLDLKALLALSKESLATKLDDTSKVDDALNYTLERLKAYYIDQSVSVDIIDAVASKRLTRPLDFDKRIKAVREFSAMSEAQALAGANKRIRNILKKADKPLEGVIDESLLVEDAEKQLASVLASLTTNVNELFEQGEYETALKALSTLQQPVDQFFDDVMVMADDEAIKQNRIALISHVGELCSQVADISRLQLES